MTDTGRSRRRTTQVRTLFRAFAGPLGSGSWLRVVLGLGLFGLGVAVLQLGGIAVWLALGAVPSAPSTSSWRRPITTFTLVYALTAWVVAPLAAQQRGRVALPCFTGPLRPHSTLYCAANRHYVDAEMAQTALRIAERVAAQHPGTVVRYLDGGFPIGEGFPMLPHITHGDGRRLDLALMWEHDDGRPARGNGSPLGYFGYAPPPDGTQPACPDAWVDLRWDMDIVQPVFARRHLDTERTRTLLQAVVAQPNIGKVLLEPHLQRALGVSNGRIRFQGCRAARHDDHMHIQL